MGLAGGGAPAAGPTDGLAGMPAARGPATPGAVRGGGPPAGGRVPVQAVRDVPRGARGQIRPHPLGGAGAGRGPLPAAPGAGRQGGIPVAGPERSPAAATGATGNATPPRRPAGVAVGAGVRSGPGPLGSGPPMAGRPRGRHPGRAGPGLRDVPGPGPSGVPPPSVAGDAPPARRAHASPAAGRTAVAAPRGGRALPAGGS